VLTALDAVLDHVAIAVPLDGRADRWWGGELGAGSLSRGGNGVFAPASTALADAASWSCCARRWGSFGAERRSAAGGRAGGAGGVVRQRRRGVGAAAIR